MSKGIKSEAFYLDDDHNSVDPDEATNAVINEYDENGNMIMETWGYTERRQNIEEKNQTTRKRSGWLEWLL